MRQPDIDRLARPFECGDGDDEQAAELSSRLGIVTGEARRLVEALVDSLDEVNKGSPALGKIDLRRRILIADTTLQAARSMKVNLLEAAIHALELRAAIEAFQAAHERRLQPRPGRPLAASPAESPMVAIRHHLVGLHLAGFFRACASALDCLGIAAIGVLGIKTRLLRGSLQSAVQGARRADRVEDAPVRSHASRGGLYMLRSIREAGPDGWDTWTIDMRNMYVHRPRRSALTRAKPRPSPVLSPYNAPYLSTEFTFVLPRDPARCDVDVFADEDQPERLVLAETCLTTVDGLLASTSRVIEECCRRLRRVWQCRRGRPSLIHQPAEQWPPSASEKRLGFAGYEPGSLELTIDAFLGHPDLQTRLNAAALLDGDRSVWDQNKLG